MIRRSTWIVLGLFALLLAGFWYLQQPGNMTLGAGTSTPTTPTGGDLVELVEDQIQAVQINSADGQTTRLERDPNGQWVLTQPQVEATDVIQAGLIVNQLTNLQAQSRVGESEGSAFGLEPPKQVITVETSSGQNQVLEVGSLTPIENGYYVRKDGTIYVAGQSEIDFILELLTNPPAMATEMPALVGTTPPAGTPQP